MLQVAIDVNFESTTLHQLSLDNGAHKEEHHSCLHLVLAQVLNNVLQEIWSTCWAKEAENGISHKHECKTEHSKIANYR
jgi:hypothetical protein